MWGEALKRWWASPQATVMTTHQWINRHNDEQLGWHQASGIRHEAYNGNYMKHDQQSKWIKMAIFLTNLTVLICSNDKWTSRVNKNSCHWYTSPPHGGLHWSRNWSRKHGSYETPGIHFKQWMCFEPLAMTSPSVSVAIAATIAAISYQASCWASTTYGRCLRCLLAHPIPQRPVVAFFAVIWSPFFSLEHVDFARDFCSFFSEFLWCQQILLEPEGFVLFTVPAFVGYTFGWQKTVEE